MRGMSRRWLLLERQLCDARLGDIEVHETHRVHEHASSAIVRARKPAP